MAAADNYAARNAFVDDDGRRAMDLSAGPALIRSNENSWKQQHPAWSPGWRNSPAGRGRSQEGNKRRPAGAQPQEEKGEASQGSGRTTIP
jgi:hypothetical protein